MPQNPDFDHTFSRRRFLALAGLVPAAALTPAVLRAASAASTPATAVTTRKVPIGIELYAVRNELTRDLTGTLRAVADMGYEAVEFYAPYFQWTPEKAREVRRTLDGLGLRCHSTHNPIASFQGDGLARAVELNQIIGSRQIVLASPPYQQAHADRVKQLAEQLTAASAGFQKHGLVGGYHNHGSEWKPFADGRHAMDIIAANTPREFVLQLDIGTCLSAGADPVAWIRANPGRIRSIHLKDWTPGEESENKGYRVLFGEGSAPWKEIIAAAESVGGVEVYLMEQEGSRYSELETARRCLATWKELTRRS